MTEGARRPATQILTRADGTSVQRLRKASLSVVKGPDRGRSVTIDKDVVAVGAERPCELVLTDQAVSTRHFEVGSTPRGFVLTDLESTNGTWVEGLRVGSCVLAGATEIQVGRTRIRFAPSKESVEIPLSSRDRYGSMLGGSPAMRRVFAVLERVAPTDATVLLEGESGTGKEVAARSVHEGSARREGPFVVVDCGAIPETLVEAELFGHERGAFTGADRERAGSFEAASGGTILLDEVGELPPHVQPKLLRVLEGREIKRVGSTRPLAIDVRVVAATNRDLAAEVSAGRFREDLYYRLAVVRVELPPLRRRREDVAELVRHFASRLGAGDAGALPFGPELMAMLVRHDWPGNVRELRNVVERLLVLPELGPAALSGPARECAEGGDHGLGPLLELPFHEARSSWNDRFERTYLEARLAASKGVVLHAAEAAGIPRQTFHRLMRKHGL